LIIGVLTLQTFNFMTFYTELIFQTKYLKKSCLISDMTKCQFQHKTRKTNCFKTRRYK